MNYPFICLGENEVIKNPQFAAEAAQLQAFAMFSADFKRRYPSGETLSEYEYIGDSVYFVRGEKAPTYRGITGKARLTQIFRAMSEDYRNWQKSGDFRKSDGLGLDGSGTHGELLEVTTWRNRASAIDQMETKLRILKTVNQIHGLPTMWQGTSWKPAGRQRFNKLAETSEHVDYICFEPTFRSLASGKKLPEGVILYEIHRLRKPSSKEHPVPIPVSLPDSAAKALREGAASQKKTRMEPVTWAETFLAEHPWIKGLIQQMVVAFGVGLVLAGLVLILSPIPGDEAAAFSLGLALIGVAR